MRFSVAFLKNQSSKFYTQSQLILSIWYVFVKLSSFIIVFFQANNYQKIDRQILGVPLDEKFKFSFQRFFLPLNIRKATISEK